GHVPPDLPHRKRVHPPLHRHPTALTPQPPANQPPHPRSRGFPASAAPRPTPSGPPAHRPASPDPRLLRTAGRKAPPLARRERVAEGRVRAPPPVPLTTPYSAPSPDARS